MQVPIPANSPVKNHVIRPLTRLQDHATLKLEPYLGFLHSNQMAKLSLVCDFQELYRYLIDDFLINYSQRISKKDFKMKTESASHGKKGKREYLTDSETKTLLYELNKFFETRVEVKRIRNGEHQTLETLINEEASCSRNISEERTSTGIQELLLTDCKSPRSANCIHYSFEPNYKSLIFPLLFAEIFQLSNNGTAWK